MSIRDVLVKELDELEEDDLYEVAEYLAFLRFRTRKQSQSNLDEVKLAALYAEFAEEDRVLAEEGLEEYVLALKVEDEL